MIDPQRLADIRFFELLDDEDRRELAKLLDELHFEQGSRLFEKGDQGEELYIVHTGAVEIYIHSVTGEKIVLTVAGKGELFGELSLLDNGPRTATAVALENTNLIVLNRDHVLHYFRKKPDAALGMIAAMGAMIRKADDLLRTRVSRNVNEEVEKLTLFQRFCDWLAWFSGSMVFLLASMLWFSAWIVINTYDVGLPKFDPYPFGLLTMIVSLEAIFLSIFVLISQNRQAEKDRIRSNIDYEVNVKAELEVAHLHEKTDRFQERVLEEFVRLRKSIESNRNDDPEKARLARSR